MTPAAFLAWLDRMVFNLDDAAEALGRSPRQVRRYADGDTPIPGPVEKLCAMIERARK